MHRVSTTVRYLLPVLAAVVLCHRGLGAQRNPYPVRPTPAPAPAATIERAALNYIQWTLSRADVPFLSIHAQRLATGQGGATPMAGGGHFYKQTLAYLDTRSDEALDHLAKADSFEVISAERVASCLEDLIANRCVRGRGFTLLSFGLPSISGNSATLDLVMFGYQAPKGQPMPKVLSLSAHGGSAQHSLFFKLEQRYGLWHVVDNRWVGQ